MTFSVFVSSRTVVVPWVPEDDPIDADAGEDNWEVDVPSVESEGDGDGDAEDCATLNNAGTMPSAFAL